MMAALSQARASKAIKSLKRWERSRWTCSLWAPRHFKSQLQHHSPLDLERIIPMMSLKRLKMFKRLRVKLI
jgi:hypothetical protein